MLFLLLIAGVVILITISILFFVVPATSEEVKESNGPFDLATAPKVPQGEEEVFTKNTLGTLRVFYYIESLPRTNTIILDTDANTVNLNPSTNLFNICEKTAGSKCGQHPGFKKLLNIGDTLWIEVLQAPDASRQGLPKTQLVIQTQQNTSTGVKQYYETFPIPEFPIQKWTMLTVVRNGSRITLYYNDRIVFSKTTTYIPIILAGASKFSEPGVIGQAKLLFTSTNAHTPKDIRSDYARTADPSGKPVEPIFSKLNITFCPSGDCFRGPQIRPANPLIEWKTDVM